MKIRARMSLPLASHTAFALARAAFLLWPGATFLPSHAAQRPGAAGMVQNACIIAMATHKCPAPPSPLGACVCKLTRHLCGANLYTPDWMVGVTKVRSISMLLFC